MIYLKKNNETQLAYIPKNGSYEGKLSYKEGYEVGKAEGIAEGKNNPYSTKGFFFENGEKEFIYPVRINRDTMLQISFLGGNTSDYVEISFYPMGNGCVLANQNDSNIVCAMRGDLLRVFIYNTLQFELPCKQEEWHTLRLYTDRVILDGEETYFNTPYTGSSVVCACVNRGGNGFYRGLIQYMKGVEGEAVMYYISNLDESGFKRLRSDNGVSDWYENNFVPVWGAFPVMQTKVPLNSVFINVEGGNVCPELTELNVSENGRYEGAYNVVNVDVPDVNGSYDEGYNNGYNDGKAEGGSCNLEETRWGNPLPFDVNESYLIIQPSMGYDGMKKVALNMDDYNTEKYNEGYEAGKAEGGDCPELTELNVTENGTYEGAYNKVNVDVPTEGGSCDYKDYRELILRAKVEEADWVDENRIWDKSKIIEYDDFNNEKTVNTIMFIDSDTEGWRGEYVTIVQKVSRMIKIKEGLFTNLEEIYELEIECTAIGENAFKGCTNLTKLVLPYPTTIGENAFKDCTNLKEIVFNTIGDISPSAFDGCPKTGIIKVKDNRFDPSKLPSTLSNWRIVYVLSGEVEEPLTPTAIEEVYDKLAFRTENLYDGDIIRDKSKLLDDSGESAEGYFITYTQNKNSVVICSQNKYTAPHVTTIENNALDWNKIEYFYSFTINTFGVDMTRDKFSNVRQIHLDSPIMNTDGADIVFRSGCFATSNLLNKIVFYLPLKVAVYDNAFEGVSSSGKVIVVGEDNAENRAKYDTLMSQLGDGWSLNFVNQYNK